jgi:hypothetical protein
MNTNLLEEKFQKSLIDHAMLTHQWKKRQPATTQNTCMERGRNPFKVYIPLRWLDNGQVIPNQNCFEKKPMCRQGTTCVNQHLHWYHAQTVKPVLTNWLWYGFTSYTWYWDQYSPGMKSVLPQVPTRQVLLQAWYCLGSYPTGWFFDNGTNCSLYAPGVHMTGLQSGTCPTLVWTLHYSWLIIEKMAGHQQASKSIHSQPARTENWSRPRRRRTLIVSTPLRRQWMADGLPNTGGEFRTWLTWLTKRIYCCESVS